MTDAAFLIITAACLAPVALIALAASAPEGWEDANGFHFGPRPSERDEQHTGREVCEGGGFDRRHSGSFTFNTEQDHAR
jgi:hypothetical protein